MDFAKLVNDILEISGWTEQALAERSGLTQPTINRIRRGKSWPTRDTAQKLLAFQPKVVRRKS